MAKDTAPLDDTSWQTGQTPNPTQWQPATGDKRAELEALASGGLAGRDAYRTGQQRVVSDQRAALDRALGAVPMMNREAGTNDFLESIIRPAGDNATARLGFAGDRFGSSMGALDSALAAALAQQGGARDLNYSTRLADGRQSTDRSLSLAREQDAAAERRRAAAEAEAAADWFNSLPLSRQEDAARGQGEAIQGLEMLQRAALDDPELKRELSRVSGRAFAHIRDPKERQALLRQVLDAGSVDEIMDLVTKYAPNSVGDVQAVIDGNQKLTSGQLERAPIEGPAPSMGDRVSGFFNGLAEPFLGTPEARRQAEVDNLLRDVASLADAQQSRLRQMEMDRYNYDRRGFVDLGGDPLIAAGLFPESYDVGASSPVNQRMLSDFYSDTGLPPSQYDEYLKAQDEQADLGWVDTKFDVATGAASNPGIIDGVLKDFGIPEPDFYRNLDPGTAGHEVLTSILSIYTDENGNILAPVLDESGTPTGEGQVADPEIHEDLIREAALSARANAIENNLPRPYADALAQIVAEQLTVYAGG